jgi:hypothetical protein
MFASLEDWKPYLFEPLRFANSAARSSSYTRVRNAVEFIVEILGAAVERKPASEAADILVRHQRCCDY